MTFKNQRWKRYGLAVAAVSAAVLLRVGLSGTLGSGSLPYVAFLPAVMLAALWGGFGPGLLATGLSAVAVGYWFLPPSWQFAIANTNDAIGLAVFIWMGILVSVMARVYRQTRPQAEAFEPELAAGAVKPTEAAVRISVLLETISDSRRRLIFNSLLFFVLAVVASLGWLVRREMAAAVAADQWVTHTRIVIKELDELLSSLKDAEAGQRGFLITGERDYLKPYEASLGGIAAHLASLRSLTADNPSQQQRLCVITSRAAAKLAELKKTIALRETKGFQAANAEVRTHLGKNIMDELRILVGQADAEEQQLLQARIVTKHNETLMTVRSVVLGGAMGSLALLMLLVTLQLELARRRRADVELRASYQKLEQAEGRQKAAAFYARSLLEASLDPLVTISPEGKITDVNEAVIKATGLPREKLIDTDFSDYFTEPEKAREGYRRVFAKNFVTDYPLTIRHKDGGLMDVLYNASVYRDARGGVIGVFAAARDITEKKAADQRLQALTEDLKRSNRDLEQFAYVASHDLQEPLRMVASFTQLLEKRYGDKLDQDAKEYIGFAEDGATRMQRLINDLLTYSRVSSRGQPASAVDAQAALGEALANLSPAIQEAGAAVTHDALPTVWMDYGQLVQLFQNLIGNAVKFHGPQPPRVHVGVRRDGGQMVFSVQDNGIGIAPEFFERIFVIFQRLHGRQDYPGTGIGLAVCKRIVERRGGRIWVESQPGQGTTIHFSIPAQGD
jgi:PAS domain S-box-containing protein